MTGDARERIDEVYRSDSRRVLATLIRLLGDFDLAEEAMHDAFTAALDAWPRDGVPDNPRAWLVSTGRFKAIDRLRRAARFDAAVDELAKQIDVTVPPDAGAEVDALEDDRLRLDLHLLPSRAASRRAHRADAARSLRPRDRADRARVPDVRADARAAHRPRQGQDPRRADSVSGAGARGSARSPRHGPPRRLSRVQRGLLRVVRRVADAARSVGRSDPARPAARRAPARARSDRPARADAAARRAARRRERRPTASWCCSTRRIDRSGIARRSPKGRRSSSARCRRARSGRIRCRPRLPRSMPRRPTRPRPTGRRSSGCTTCCCEPIRRRSSSSIARPRSRCATVPKPGLALIDAIPRARRSRRLPPRAFGASGPAAPPRPHRRRDRVLRARAGADDAGAGAQIHRTADYR